MLVMEPIHPHRNSERQVRPTEERFTGTVERNERDELRGVKDRRRADDRKDADDEPECDRQRDLLGRDTLLNYQTITATARVITPGGSRVSRALRKARCLKRC